MKFKELASYFERIEKTSSRLTITEILAELFKKTVASEFKNTVYLLQGRLCPLYEAIDFGMAEKMIIKSAVLALHIKKESFIYKYHAIGDLGKTIEYFKQQIKTLTEKDLNVKAVYEDLYKMATAGGAGSQEVKINILTNLIKDLDSLSCRFLVRIPIGSLRLGFSDMTILDAYSWLESGNKTLRPEIERAYHVRPDLGLIGSVMKTEGVKGLKKIKPAVFTPILMMRAERLPTGKEIVEKIGRCAIEPKYDGFRLQIHYRKNGGKVQLYSRNLENATYMYPDVVSGVKNEIRADEAILEGEAIGFDPHSGSFLPFQETVQRKRKYDIEKMSKEIPLKLFVFELLYINGKNLLLTPYLERRRLLEKHIRLTGDIFKDTILLSPEHLVDNEKKLELLFDDALTKGLEGIVAKKLDGIYQPGARGWNWIKFKRSYSSKIQDSIDCLVMGYDYGKGKRAGFGIGAFLVGVYDEKQDKFFTVAKIGTGLSDEEWRQLQKRAQKYKSDKRPALYDVDKLMVADVWMKPSIVVEIKADEITKSPVHTAGRKMKSSKSGSAFDVDVPGFALRFPRLVRFRDDKRPEETTTLKEMKEMYAKQRK